MKTTLEQAPKRHRHRTKAPSASAVAAGLKYKMDDGPGITRVRQKAGFRYIDPQGKPLRDEETLKRIKALAIPPAWTDVWICPEASGHLQATGRDERGRKQYRYHARWRETRDQSKYARMIPFGKLLPKIREAVGRDLSLPGLPRRKVLAAVVRLLETTMIRVGNDEYARTNKSFGLTTLQDNHVEIHGKAIQFRFKGKSGVRHSIGLDDKRLATIIKKCQDLPGQELFQYLDEAGEVRDIGSDDVNGYLREISGQEFTAKDFRTWAGTVLAAIALREFEAFDSQTQAKKNIVRAIEAVASRLGNTPSVCRKCYVHPIVLGSYLDGTMVEVLKKKAERELADLHSLKPEEAAVLALLSHRLANPTAD